MAKKYVKPSTIATAIDASAGIGPTKPAKPDNVVTLPLNRWWAIRPPYKAPHVVGKMLVLPAEDEPPPSMLEVALAYAEEHDWTVFPANLEDGKKESYLSMDYAPEGLRWGQSKDPKQIRKNFTDLKWRLKCGIGVPTGADNGIFVIEADTKKGGHKHDGLAELAKLEAKHGKLPMTLMAMSPSGSVHRYYKYPKGITVKGSIGDDQGHGIAPGVDVKSDGGMVIAAPSVRGDGVYEWLNNVPIAEAPQWLLDLVREDQKEEKTWVDEMNEEHDPAPLWKIEMALAVTPVPPYLEYIDLGRSIWHETRGSAAGYLAFDTFSKKSPEYNKKGGEPGGEFTRKKWLSFRNTNSITIGTLFHYANLAEPDWQIRWDRPDIQAKYRAFQRAKEKDVYPDPEEVEQRWLERQP